MGRMKAAPPPRIFRAFSGSLRQRPALRNRRTCAYGGALERVESPDFAVNSLARASLSPFA